VIRCIIYAGGELWQHIGDHYSEAYAARIMRYVLQTIAQVGRCCQNAPIHQLHASVQPCVSGSGAPGSCQLGAVQASVSVTTILRALTSCPARNLTCQPKPMSRSSMTMAWCGGT